MGSATIRIVSFHCCSVSYAIPLPVSGGSTGITPVSRMYVTVSIARRRALSDAPSDDVVKHAIVAHQSFEAALQFFRISDPFLV